MPGFTQEQIDEMFKHHPPTEEQEKKYQELRGDFKALAMKVKDYMPDSPTQTIAIRRIWEALQTVNSGIATEGKV